jgi:DNA-binding SARP family transcriptional activator
MEFRVLGPVEMHVESRRVDIGHARQRAVLAVLLLDLNKVVSTDRLIDRVWGEEPPVSVRNVVYGLVARLRAAITEASEPRASISRRATGYVLEADPELLDLHRFRQQAALASTASGDDEASALLRSALSNWHGEALAGLSSSWLASMRHALEQQRTAAVLELNDIALRQGRHHALIGELTELLAAHQTNERATGQLMLALYRAGRQAEALHSFEQTRQRLADELGADPGPELQMLHQQILRSDRALLHLQPPSSRPTNAAASWHMAPRELPSDVSTFVGRERELAELDRLAGFAVDRSGEDRTTSTDVMPSGSGTAAIVISAVSGTAGVGKTALAVRWALRSAARFPDGQLYVNLRGYDQAEPLTAADALAGFLRSLGVQGEDIPAEADQRASRYRSMLAGRQMLIVLDNARSADQVRPLLAGGIGSVVVVTSRDALAGLVARDGACRIDLEVLPLDDAVRLLRELIGARVDEESDAAAVLAEQCCRLPLALRIAAELAVTRRASRLRQLTDELADKQRRLFLLDAGGDPHTAVRAVFSWSYVQLGLQASKAFRLAGLHPGVDFDAFAVAALAATSPDQAEQVLSQLARAHLVAAASPRRYAMHDLLRAYARESCLVEGDDDEQRTALTRLFDYYLHTTAAAMDALIPAEAARRPREIRYSGPAPDLTDPRAARGWLDAERANLIAVAVHAADNGWATHTTRLAATLWRYLDIGGHFPEAVVIHGFADRAAARSGDSRARADAKSSMGAVDMRQGRYDQAALRYHEARALYHQTADGIGEARAVHNLAQIYQRLGRYADAAGHLRDALALYRANGDHVGEARALSKLGALALLRRQYEEAIGYQRTALILFRKVGDKISEARALILLSSAARRRGLLEEATSDVEDALRLSCDLGDKTGQADALTSLGELHRYRGNYQQALAVLEEALSIYQQMGNQSDQSEALNIAGDVLFAAGQTTLARSYHFKALELADETAYREQQANAHRALAFGFDATGDADQARLHWERALECFCQLDDPEAEQIRSLLATRSPALHGDL